MFETRSNQLELIDTGDYTPEEYAGCLVELRRINRWLGDQTALKNSLLKEIEKADLREFSMLDVGAGSGELLRFTANFARGQKRQAKLCGLDFNRFSASAILAESKDFREISAVRGDALQLPFAAGAFDYAICSLFTHHLPDEMVVETLREMRRVTRRKIFVIDLHRHPVAYYAYISLGKIFLRNRLTRHDGAISILRSFKPAELEDLARRAGLENISVKKHFPYRLVLQTDTE